jgi:hypothetical protein
MGQIQVFIWYSVEKDGGGQKIDDLRRANMVLRAQTKQLKKEKYDLMQENKELKQANNLTVQTVEEILRLWSSDTHRDCLHLYITLSLSQLAIVASFKPSLFVAGFHLIQRGNMILTSLLTWPIV